MKERRINYRVITKRHRRIWRDALVLRPGESLKAEKTDDGFRIIVKKKATYG